MTDEQITGPRPLADDDSLARIVDYWNRRPALARHEWVDFYQRAVRLLLRTHLPEEYRDDARRRDLINCFFQDKILLNAETSKAGPLQSAYALHGYLKNYEKDVRSAQPTEVSLEQLRERRGYEASDEDGAAPDLPDSDSDPDPDHGHGGASQPPTHAGLLAEAGIDVRAAMHSADHFITTLGQGELAYLRHHSCADDKPEPVSTIAQRLALGSTFHLRAKKLGITRTKGDTYRGYEHTAIGAWLRSIGAQLDPEWRQELAALLVLLCHQVRLRAGALR